jgi:hypothetical protein
MAEFLKVLYCIISWTKEESVDHLNYFKPHFYGLFGYDCSIVQVGL